MRDQFSTLLNLGPSEVVVFSVRLNQRCIPLVTASLILGRIPLALRLMSMMVCFTLRQASSVAVIEEKTRRRDEVFVARVTLCPAACLAAFNDLLTLTVEQRQHGVEGRRPCSLSAVKIRPAPPRTGRVALHHIRCFDSGCLRIFALPNSLFVIDSILLSIWLFSNAQKYLVPFALCRRLSRTPSVVVTPPTGAAGSTAPPMALAAYIRLPLSGARGRPRRCSHSSFSVSRKNLSVILMTCGTDPEARRR